MATKLLWGAPLADEPSQTNPVAVPAVFGALDFRIKGTAPPDSNHSLSPLYFHVFFAADGSVCSGGAERGTHGICAHPRPSKTPTLSSHLVRDSLSQERAQTTATEEVASLSSSINQMLDRHYEQRQALNREGEKLVDLANALKHADKRKDEYVAMLAHELRNPLAPIMTGARSTST